MSLEQVKTATKSSCPLFSLNGTVAYGKAVDIYDGDTFDLVLAYNNQLFHFKARMYGYDSPEMKPALSTPNREAVKEAAVKAKVKLWSYLAGQNPIGDSHNDIFVVYCHEFDKYGRLLISAFSLEQFTKVNETLNRLQKASGSVFDETFSSSINAKMIAQGHGYAYYGGTKQSWLLSHKLYNKTWSWIHQDGLNSMVAFRINF